MVSGLLVLLYHMYPQHWEWDSVSESTPQSAVGHRLAPPFCSAHIFRELRDGAHREDKIGVPDRRRSEQETTPFLRFSDVRVPSLSGQMIGFQRKTVLHAGPLCL